MIALLALFALTVPGQELDSPVTSELAPDAALRAWGEAYPAAVFPLVRDHLHARFAADEPGRANAEAELERLARTFPEAPWSSYARRVRSWSATQQADYLALREKLVASTRAEPTTAEELWSEALGLGAEGLLLKEFGSLGHRLGDGAEGRDLVARVGQRASELGAWSLALWSAEWRAQEAWRTSQLDTAVDHFERALSMAEILEPGAQAAERVRLLCDLAYLEGVRGELERALGLAAEASRLARGDESAAGTTGRRRAAATRASFFEELGEYRSALDELLALETTPVVEDDIQVRADLIAAAALSDLGRLEEAVGRCRRALSAAERESVATYAPLLQLEARLQLGLYLGDLGQYEEGLARLDRVAADFESIGDTRGVGWAHKNRGWIFLRSERFAEAAREFAQARARAKDASAPSLEVLATLGWVEARVFGSDEGISSAAASELEQALSFVDQRGDVLQDPTLAWRVAHVRGRLAESSLDRPDLEAALGFYARAVEALERWRRRLGVPRLASHALRERADPYRAAAFVAARLNRPLLALSFAERLQGGVLEELRLASARTEPESAQLRDLRRKLFVLSARLRAERDETRVAEIEDELRKAETELDAELLRVSLAGVHAGRRAPVPSASELQMRVSNSGFDLVLSYLVGEDQTLCFALGPERIELLHLAVGREDWRSLAHRMRRPVQALAAGEVDLAHLDFDVEAARALYDHMIAPARPRPGTRLALVLDDALATVPLAALVVGGVPGRFDPRDPHARWAALEYTIDRFSITQLSSLRSLEASKPAVASERAPLVIVRAPDAIAPPRAGEEVQRLLALGPAVDLPDATASVFHGLDVRGGILHVAAHGSLFPSRPADGHLLLGASSEAQRRSETRAAEADPVFAWQIEGETLRAELTVLSACHTAEGDWIRGEGLLGLARGFLAGGSRRVVGSLWAAEDSATVELMVRFHTRLGRGVESSEALAAAQRDIRDIRDTGATERPWAHPFFWSGWVLLR